MIGIRHKITGVVLRTVKADTLRGAKLRRASLNDANLANAKLTRADLSGASLHRAELFYADLSDASLRDANLWQADLVSADLSRANLHGADLSRANLTCANLTDAHLGGADLTQARLGAAALTGATLTQTDLIGTEMTGTDLANAWFGNTVIVDCSTLAHARGLDLVRHSGPSNLDARTLRACVTKLPDVFLVGCGYNRDEIEYLRAMYAERAIKYYSCFLSHASDDADFADRLHADLLANNVSCWHYRYDMKGGDYWRPQINEALRAYDKTVVICSERSLRKVAVIEEILASIRTERKTGVKKLFPIRLDEFILSRGMEEVVASLPDQARREEWWEYVPEYHIPDFSKWEDSREYKREFDKLLRDLKTASKN